jgi:hypothetical protein
VRATSPPRGLPPGTVGYGFRPFPANDAPPGLRRSEAVLADRIGLQSWQAPFRASCLRVRSRRAARKRGECKRNARSNGFLAQAGRPRERVAVTELAGQALRVVEDAAFDEAAAEAALVLSCSGVQSPARGRDRERQRQGRRPSPGPNKPRGARERRSGGPLDRGPDRTERALRPGNRRHRRPCRSSGLDVKRASTGSVTQAGSQVRPGHEPESGGPLGARSSCRLQTLGRRIFPMGRGGPKGTRSRAGQLGTAVHRRRRGPNRAGRQGCEVSAGKRYRERANACFGPQGTKSNQRKASWQRDRHRSKPAVA